MKKTDDPVISYKEKMMKQQLADLTIKIRQESNQETTFESQLQLAPTGMRQYSPKKFNNYTDSS